MCNDEFILLHRKAILLKEFRRVSHCYEKLVSAFEEAYSLGEEQANFALLELVTKSNQVFVDLQQAAYDLEHELRSLPEPMLKTDAIVNH